MAMARVNRPALMVYGGTIRAGELDGLKLDIVSAFQSYGEYLGRCYRRQPPAGHRAQELPRGRGLRRDVHGQHHGLGHRGHGHGPALQRQPAG